MDVAKPFPERWTDRPGSAVGAPILARWPNWPPSRASPRRWGQLCRLCSGQRLKRCKEHSDGYSVAIASAALARKLLFSVLTQRCLDYYLSRELNNHIGPDAQFRDDRARSEFDGALDRHCREASRIVEAFAGGWYGKNAYQGDGLTPDSVRRFAPVAFKKFGPNSGNGQMPTNEHLVLCGGAIGGARGDEKRLSLSLHGASANVSLEDSGYQPAAAGEHS